jgi:RimJ/RimL family protein N-acetyltransferase
LSVAERNERAAIINIGKIAENLFISKENQARLKKYAADKRYFESSAYAKSILDDFHNRLDERKADESAIAETERLLIRKFNAKDVDVLFAIMQKPEVMYAWEHGFTKSEVGEWIKKQTKRYNTDGYGYFAVIRKEDDKLIGQSGLMDSEIEDEPVTEIPENRASVKVAERLGFKQVGQYSKTYRDKEMVHLILVLDNPNC